MTDSQLEEAKRLVEAATSTNSKRQATCGACGCEKYVGDWMRRRERQFRSRPTEPTDLFYCGCEDPYEEDWRDL